MRREAVAVQDAVGRTLAHRLPLPGRTLKKGEEVGDDDLQALLDAGVERVPVIVLEDGDVREDEAAALLAEAAAGEGVEARPPGRGRCELVARASGLLVVNREAVTGLNRTDEALTLATAAPGLRVEKGTVVAMAKVIPLAVSRSVLDAGIAEISTATPPIQLAAFIPHRVGLILTALDHTSESALERTERTVAACLERSGSALGLAHRCAHEVGPLSEGILRMLEAELSPILIAGAVSPADRADVIPEAIEESGGEILRVGLPVEPGNMMLVGRRGGVPVMSVPACASPARRTGFDAVLERILAGLDFGPEALAEIGVGGLLPKRAGGSE